jgi:hypothetical protein
MATSTVGRGESDAAANATEMKKIAAKGLCVPPSSRQTATAIAECAMFQDATIQL